ncbi:MAG: hypothetical protein RIB60_07565 [Phycisphaerales bacterium]
MSDENPYTDEQRADIQDMYRGRDLCDGKFRGFCGSCGLPLACSTIEMAMKVDIACDECAVHTPSAEMRSAFSPHRREGGT